MREDIFRRSFALRKLTNQIQTFRKLKISASSNRVKMGKKVRFSDHEVYFGSFMLLMGLIGVAWKLFVDFPSLLVLFAGVFILANEAYKRMLTRGLEHYFPTLYNILYRESLFDLAFNQNHITRFVRMMYDNSYPTCLAMLI